MKDKKLPVPHPMSNNLSKGFTNGLIKEITKVKEEYIVPCELHAETEIEGTSYTVTFFDANHCPGAAMAYFFDKETKRTVLHTGDFRADEDKVQKNEKLMETLLVMLLSVHAFLSCFQAAPFKFLLWYNGFSENIAINFFPV